ncbi:MAG: S-adenosylmethionine decarboxylase [Candidatus Peregrinibacteria bacterium]|nr:S-adenosylmethionine decarboxylase [Candidatus Peregrinibacteria bacterium]
MNHDNQNHSDEVVLHHELFVLDANLRELLPDDGPMTIKKMVTELLEILKMERLGPLELYQATDVRAPGFSFIQPITTSHISGHYFEKPGKHPHLHFDIYSCKIFSWRDVIPLLDRYLCLHTWSANCITRSTDTDRSYCELRGEGREILEEVCLAKTARVAVVI